MRLFDLYRIICSHAFPILSISQQFYSLEKMLLYLRNRIQVTSHSVVLVWLTNHKGCQRLSSTCRPCSLLLRGYHVETVLPCFNRPKVCSYIVGSKCLAVTCCSLSAPLGPLCSAQALSHHSALGTLSREWSSFRALSQCSLGMVAKLGMSSRLEQLGIRMPKSLQGRVNTLEVVLLCLTLPHSSKRSSLWGHLK